MKLGAYPQADRFDRPRRAFKRRLAAPRDKHRRLVRIMEILSVRTERIHAPFPVTQSGPSPAVITRILEKSQTKFASTSEEQQSRCNQAERMPWFHGREVVWFKFLARSQRCNVRDGSQNCQKRWTKRAAS
jgi:hypothetical protein